MTVAEWVNGLTGMPVTGVVRNYTAPPSQLGTADLPCLYPRLPAATTPISTFGSGSGLTTCNIELVIALKPLMQGTHTTRYTTMLTMIDNWIAALKSEAASDNSIDTWTITGIETNLEEGTTYWLLVCRVEGSI